MTKSLVELHMPVLARTAGQWEGTYTEVDMTNAVVDQYRFELDISFPDENGAAYRQATRYRWSDGRSQDFVFDASLTLASGRAQIYWDHEVMFGTLFEVDDRTLQLRFTYKGPEVIEVQEAMFVSADGRHRMRTWHWYKDGAPYRKTLVDEVRV
jgi:hypothetical protein